MIGRLIVAMATALTIRFHGALRIVILYLPPKFGDSSMFGLVVTIV